MDIILSKWGQGDINVETLNDSTNPSNKWQGPALEPAPNMSS